jgi:hypothetical protein
VLTPDQPPTPCDRRSDIGTTTSTAYAYALVGAVGCEVVFIAPDDGTVWITSECQLANSNGEATFQAVEVRTESAVLLAATGQNPPVTHSRGLSETRYRLPVMGLEPGRRYVARQLFRVSGGTGVVGARKLSVGRELT